MIFSPEVWVALASSIIAMGALGVSVWTGYQAREHNKLSVRPLISAYESYDVTDDLGVVSIEILNAGLGPAVIKDFVLVYDGEEVAKNNRKLHEDFLREKTRGLIDPKIVHFVPNSSLLAGERCEIFSFSYYDGQNISFIDKLNIRINYTSIYGDEIYAYDSNKDRQFQGKELKK